MKTWCWDIPGGAVDKNLPTRDMDLIPDQEDSTCQGAIKPVCHNYWARTLEPELCNKRSRRNKKATHHNLQVGRMIFFFNSCLQLGTSLVAQRVKRLPTVRETRVQSLGREDLLEKEMATHSSILAWKMP